MHTRLARCLTAFMILSLSVAAAAQERRPAATRTVPVDLLCGAQATLTLPARTIRIVGSGSERGKALFAPGDAVIINAGTAQGIQAGQRFYVRRVVEDRFTVRTTEKQPYSIHTAGWVTVVDAKADVATATVAEACDGILEGDYLEPLVLPAPPSAIAAGTPDFARPARVILGDDRRQLGAGGGSLMVIDRGSDHGLRAGQRLTLFRRTLDGDAPVVTIGDAIITSTQFETSLMRIEKSREAIQVGDLVAIHR
ncbi:MAG: hypothetical protein H0W08_13495 [Acidobacteria bacterium]|nr:hypothetical protein [Acidobacteriota bacterium]